MYIATDLLLNIHFYNKECYMYSYNTTDSICILDEVEAFFLNSIIKESNYERLLEKINIEAEIFDKELTRQTIDKILKNLSDIFYLSDKYVDLGERIKVSGELNQKYPYSIELCLTNACNHKCIHCYKGIPDKCTKLDFGEITELLEFIKGKTRYIQLTGGDPFLYPNFTKLINTYWEDFSFTITTSGYILNESILDALAKVGMVQISLYSQKKELHDDFTRLDGSFEKIMRNIRLMQSRGIHVTLSSLVTPKNIINMEDFVIFCIEQNIPTLTMGSIAELGNAVGTEGMILSEQDLIVVRAKLKELSSKYSSEISIEPWDDFNCPENCDDLFTCQAGRLKWHIHESGRITPCALFESEIFNLGSIYNKDYISLIMNLSRIDSIEALWIKRKSMINDYYSQINIDFSKICNKFNSKILIE